MKAILGRKIETKYYNYGWAPLAVTSTPGYYNMSLIPQGVADEQRVGDSIKLKKLTVRFQAVGGDIYNTLRVVVFRFKQDTSVGTPGPSDVYNTQATGSEYVMCPVPGLEHADKVHVIYDKVVTLPQTNYYTSSTQITQTANSIKTWKLTLFGKRLGAKTIRFNPGATSGYGHIWMAICSDSSVLPNPTLYVNSQIEYNDA